MKPSKCAEYSSGCGRCCSAISNRVLRTLYERANPSLPVPLFVCLSIRPPQLTQMREKGFYILVDSIYHCQG